MLEIAKIGTIAIASMLIMGGSIGTGGDEIAIKEQPKIAISKAYEKIADGETSQEKIYDVQINVPIKYEDTKTTAKPPEYTPAATPPPEPEQTVPTNDEYEYVEEFGYVKKGGPTKVIIGESDGDIDKIVASMD